MAQVDIHRYRRAGSRVRFVVDLQSDLLEPIATRVVAPLYPLPPGQKLLKGLNPEIEVPGDDGVFYLSVPELAAVQRSVLGERVGNLETRRADIVSALDLLFTGI